MQIIVCKRWHLLHFSGNNAAQPKLTTGAAPGALVQKAVRVMKLTAFFILATCLHVNATDGLGQKVTLSEREVHVEKIFNEIKKQTGYNFLYTSNILANTHRVTVNVTNALLTAVLDMVLAGQGLEYRVKGEDRLIIIKTKPPVKTVAEVASPAGDPIDVTGKVTDDEGRPLPGANVKVRGSNVGVVTDKDGRFSLRDIPENSVLEISYVGHEIKTFTVRGSGMVNIALEQKLSMMDETVVIAYGTTTRRFATGNIGAVKASEIERQPVNNVLLALEGRVPGLVINQMNGISGGPITVRLQGQNSIGSGNDPLYVIDGVPYISQMLKTTNGQNILGSNSGGNPLSYINVADIESVNILKDADATSIYGSRAANGAILITTKKGTIGKTRFDINFQQGWGKVTRMLNMMDTQQYLEMRREAFSNDNVPMPSIYSDPNNGDYDVNGLWDTTRYTNWQKELIGGTAHFTKGSIGVSGGVSNIQYLLSGTYQRETTVFPGDFSDQKGSLHLNLSSGSVNQRLKFQFAVNFMVDKNILPRNDLTQTSILLAPNAPSLYNEDGSLNWALTPKGSSSWILGHPLSYIYSPYENNTKNLISNVIIAYRLATGLELKSNFGYTSLVSKEFNTALINGVKPEERPNYQRSANYSNSSINTFIVEPQLNYIRKFKKSSIEVLVGSTIQQQNNEGQSFVGTDYANDGVLKDMRAALTLKVTNTVSSVYKYNAAFGRVNFNLKERYIINLNARRDGSSRFGSKNQFHNFGSVGFAWIFCDEPFLKRYKTIINFGKLRGSYGTTGNDQIGDYSFMGLYANVTSGNAYQGVASLQPGAIPNAYLEWEETKKLQFGVDLGLLSDRIVIATTFVHNRSSNQLLQYSLPSITGAGSVTTNFPATVQNLAWEFSLNSINVNRRRFKWNTSLNITIPKNKLVSFPNLQTSSYASQLIVGQPIGIVKALNFLGVNPLTGIYMLDDINENPTSFPNNLTDRKILINADPRFYGGIQNSFEIKNFKLSIFLQFSKQLSLIYPVTGSPGLFIVGMNNQPTSVLNRWRKPGDNALFQKYSQNSSLVNINTLTSTRVYGDASYIRLRNVNLSYNLPNNWIKRIGFQNLTIYITGQNILTITKYEGMDPENRIIGMLPPLKVVSFGIQASL